MKKDDTLLIKISKDDKKTFIEMCKHDDTTASREVRSFIKRYIKMHNDLKN